MKTDLITSGRATRAGRAGGAAVLALSCAAAPALADISFGDFSSASGLHMMGAAAHTNTTISLTPAVERVAGAVWGPTRQRFTNGFETSFAFRISEVSGTGADGIAFVIQNASVMALGGTGGGMGYANNNYFAQMGIPNSLAVEFDTWDNTAHDWPDLPASHVSVHTRGLLPNDPSEAYSLGAAMAPTPFDNGAVHTARIVYDPGLLRVFLDGANLPIVSVPLEIGGSVLSDDGLAWVGFTSATGGATDVERHEVLNWTYTEHPAPTPGAVALLALGGFFISSARTRKR